MYDQKTLRSLLAGMGVITTSFGLLANLIDVVSTEGLRKIFKGGIKIQYSGGSLECDMSGVYAAKMRDCIAGHLRAKDSTVNVVVSPTPNTHPENNPYGEIKKLKELLDLDLITSEEFDCKKKQLLGL